MIVCIMARPGSGMSYAPLRESGLSERQQGRSPQPPLGVRAISSRLLGALHGSAFTILIGVDAPRIHTPFQSHAGATGDVNKSVPHGSKTIARYGSASGSTCSPGEAHESPELAPKESIHSERMVEAKPQPVKRNASPVRAGQSNRSPAKPHDHESASVTFLKSHGRLGVLRMVRPFFPSLTYNLGFPADHGKDRRRCAGLRADLIAARGEYMTRTRRRAISDNFSRKGKAGLNGENATSKRKEGKK
jgi:hypothetical protein